MRVFVKQNGAIEFLPDNGEVLRLDSVDAGYSVVAVEDLFYNVPKSEVTLNPNEKFVKEISGIRDLKTFLEQSGL